MAPAGAALWRSLHAYQVFGANTDIGKTVISTLIYKASQVQHPERNHWFLKPVSTGPEAEADDSHITRFARGVSVKTLCSFDEPVSPHLAARSTTPPRDNQIVSSVLESLDNWANTSQQKPGLALLETAGGVHSPGPNGTSQADLYRPLRLPAILVADSRLGGISSSVSSFESLALRGYDVESVILFQNNYYKNDEFLSDYFGKMDIPVFSFPAPPDRPESNPESSLRDDRIAMSSYYESAAGEALAGTMISLLSHRHNKRLRRLDSMSNRASDVIWYPFTQHKGVASKDITVIDSAHGDYFQAYKEPTRRHSKEEKASTGNKDSLVPQQEDSRAIQSMFDGSASWWTQGLGHANPALSLSAAYAAGRYGHVMFAGAIHEPALSLAELLVKSVGNPRLQKVFYSDNGSTGMEVAIKMGLRAACARYGWDANEQEVGIIGLQGSYHGDTIGVMDCSEPSTFNQKVEWYRGRGYWFDFPQVKLVKGTWVVDVPDSLKSALGESTQFSNLDEIFDLNLRNEQGGGDRYEQYVKSTLEDLVLKQGKKFGAVMLEPVLLGAGGMIFVDPLFQHALVQVVRKNPHIFSQGSSTSNDSDPPKSPTTKWSGLPIIFDEVFTGLYRLGRFTSASFLGIDPDVSVHAKLLTGGLVPLCVTLASEDIFKAFLSANKSDALLHGHSYTAHAVGCNVAVESLKTMIGMERDGHWNEYKRDWSLESSGSGQSARDKITEGQPGIWSSWSQSFVNELSHAGSVESVFALGSVLSISLRDPGAGGYTSTAAKGLQESLSGTSDQGFSIHSRVLGNVLYLMASMTSTPSELRQIEAFVRACLLGDKGS